MRVKVLEFYRTTQNEGWRDQSSWGWRWRARATNGKILADSGEAYGRLRSAEHGARLVTGLQLVGLKPGDRYEFTGWRVEVEA